jgi:acetyl-CoA carboxylase biotin carboxylase subunit
MVMRLAPRFEKVLIANRGEIAVRVIRACREMGLGTVAVFSDVDRDALHVRMADEAHGIGPAPSRDSYLAAEKILGAARRSGAQAIHPGYGFLAENADFARACEAAGIVFIGPPADAIDAMGNKVEARRRMAAAGAACTPGSEGRVESAAEVREWGTKLGYPILLKAEAGGGGKGMRVLEGPEAVDAGYRTARSEAGSAFGDDAVYVEKYLADPRHIEFQIFCDGHGNAVHLGERECSIQRRHQKLIEEAPSCVVDAETRARMGKVAVEVARAAGYVGAGTVEFLHDAAGNFYFMEMNTRLQVEHPVTEMVTGLDLVKLQIRIAAGERLPFTQDDVVLRGHAIECRIQAEDPDHDFMPCPGKIITLRIPSGPGIRDDSAIYAGFQMPIEYDAMIAKLIAWGSDRTEAIERMSRALREYVINGMPTTIPFHRRVMQDPRFRRGEIHTGYLRTPPAPAERSPEDEARLRDVALAAAAIAAYRRKAAAAPIASGAEGGSRWKQAGRLEGLR